MRASGRVIVLLAACALPASVDEPPAMLRAEPIGLSGRVRLTWPRPAEAVGLVLQRRTARKDWEPVPFVDNGRADPVVYDRPGTTANVAGTTFYRVVLSALPDTPALPAIGVNIPAAAIFVVWFGSITPSDLGVSLSVG